MNLLKTKLWLAAPLLFLLKTVCYSANYAIDKFWIFSQNVAVSTVFEALQELAAVPETDYLYNEEHAKRLEEIERTLGGNLSLSSGAISYLPEKKPF